MWLSFKVTVVAVLLSLFLTNLSWSATFRRPKVVVISMDGFRYDYLSKVNTPNFDKMISSGVTMPYMNNTFVTLTFPCHYTMATGLYEESHGIVANRMYDYEFDSYFSLGTTEPRWWEGGEPLWITAKKAGLKTGVFFWPGSEAEIFGIRPDEWRKYNGSIPYEERVETAISWLVDDDFDLCHLYFDEPDRTGHHHGPDSNETMRMIERMDEFLGFILQRLEDRGLKDVVNLIVTSDHGMANIDTLNKLIDVSDYVDSSLLLEVVQQGSTAHLRPQPGKAQELVDALSYVPHMTVMLKEDLPDRYHYKNNRRVQPVVAMADRGWQITGNASALRRPNYGAHGYDNLWMQMKPIFVASGPAFKSGVVVEPIRSVDIYPLVCHLLGINPAPNNGSLERVSPLLQIPITSVG